MQLFSTIKKRVKNSISFLTDENTAKKIVNKITFPFFQSCVAPPHFSEGGEGTLN